MDETKVEVRLLSPRRQR